MVPVVLLLIIVHTPILVTGDVEVQYKKQLYQVLPEFPEDLEFLSEIQKTEHNLVFWNGIQGIGQPTEILASPKAIKEIFHEAPLSLRKSLRTIYSSVSIDMKEDAAEVSDYDAQLSPNISPPYHIRGKIIQGTDLSTGTYYEIGLRRFDSEGGYLTLTRDKFDSDKQHRYAIVKKNVNAIPRYQPDGISFNEVLWYFAPSHVEGWYTLHIRFTEDNFSYALTWSREKAKNDLTYVHLVLRRMSNETQDEIMTNNDFLWKPVATSDEGGFRLVSKAFSNDFVTWTNQAHGSGSEQFYLQVEVSNDAEYRTKYDKGKEWWEDTLFTFHPLKSELEAKISQIELDTRSVIEDGLMPLHMKTECDNHPESRKNLTFVNQGSTEEIQKVKFTATVEGEVVLQLRDELPQGSKVIIDKAKLVAPWSVSYIECSPTAADQPSSQSWLKTTEKIALSTSLVVPPRWNLTIQVCSQFIELSETDTPLPVVVTAEISCKTERPSMDYRTSVTTKGVNCVDSLVSKEYKDSVKVVGCTPTSKLLSLRGDIIIGRFGYQAIAVPVL